MACRVIKPGTFDASPASDDDQHAVDSLGGPVVVTRLRIELRSVLTGLRKTKWIQAYLWKAGRSLLPSEVLLLFVVDLDTRHHIAYRISYIKKVHHQERIFVWTISVIRPPPLNRFPIIPHVRRGWARRSVRVCARTSTW